MAEPKANNKTSLIVCDIEGCLSPGKGYPLNLTALAEIQDHNRRARAGNEIPLVLCTGRPQAFVEVFCQILDVHLPCVCENGAFLYDSREDRMLRNPNITGAQIDALEELSLFLETVIMDVLPHRREPGKEICISLNPEAPPEYYADRIGLLFERVRANVSPELFTVTHSASAVDITPRGIDKASGVRFLSDMLNVPPEEMLGIGDSTGDMPFLMITGLAAAPSNASESVKAMVDYASTQPESLGVLDILAWGDTNNEQAIYHV